MSEEDKLEENVFIIIIYLFIIYHLLKILSVEDIYKPLEKRMLYAFGFNIYI